MATAEKQAMIVAFEYSEHSSYAREWMLSHFFLPCSSNPPSKLLIVHAKPSPSSPVTWCATSCLVYGGTLFGDSSVTPFFEHCRYHVETLTKLQRQTRR